MEFIIQLKKNGYTIPFEQSCFEVEVYTLCYICFFLIDFFVFVFVFCFLSQDFEVCSEVVKKTLKCVLKVVKGPS